LGDQIKNNELGGICSIYGDRCIQSLVGRPQAKRRLERYMNKLEDNIKMHHPVG